MTKKIGRVDELGGVDKFIKYVSVTKSRTKTRSASLYCTQNRMINKIKWFNVSSVAAAAPPLGSYFSGDSVSFTAPEGGFV